MRHLILWGLSLLMFHPILSQTETTYPFQYEKSGQGARTLIFIPGFASSGELWDQTKAIYEKNYSCYTLTMAGFAHVPPRPNPGFEPWKEAIAGFIEDKGLDRPVLIGHSMGGALAMAIAAEQPERISKVVVVDALPCLAALTDPTFQPRKELDCSPITDHLTGLDGQEFERMQRIALTRLLHNTDMLDTVLRWSLESDRWTFARMYCDFSNTDLRPRLETIKCPILVLLEAGFRTIAPMIEAQFEALETAEFHYADKGAHFIMYDDT